MLRVNILGTMPQVHRRIFYSVIKTPMTWPRDVFWLKIILDGYIHVVIIDTLWKFRGYANLTCLIDVETFALLRP